MDLSLSVAYRNNNIMTNSLNLREEELHTGKIVKITRLSLIWRLRFSIILRRQYGRNSHLAFFPIYQLTFYNFADTEFICLSIHLLLPSMYSSWLESSYWILNGFQRKCAMESHTEIGTERRLLSVYANTNDPSHTFFEKIKSRAISSSKKVRKHKKKEWQLEIN